MCCDNRRTINDEYPCEIRFSYQGLVLGGLRRHLSGLHRAFLKVAVAGQWGFKHRTGPRTHTWQDGQMDVTLINAVFLRHRHKWCVVERGPQGAWQLARPVDRPIAP